MPDIIKSKRNLESSWKIQKGKFFKSFLSNLKGFDREAKKTLVEETEDILKACNNPKSKEPYIGTGSVVGYVQSGKTTSFNALSMLALDNGYNFIIVLGGRNNPLLNQNRKEFRDLLSPFTENESVNFFEASGISEISDIPIKNLSKENSFFHDEAKPLVTVILKHQGHLKELTRQLGNSRDNKIVISNTNALIIDDEADNASLNGLINEEGEQTAIYKELTRLRDVLPRHSLVQYTATPQALLLASKSDHYSPDWVRVITPGNAYVGGNELFNNDSCQSLVIPESDVIGTKKKDLEGFELPGTFFDALIEFLLIACQCRIKKEIFDKNLTMLVHPGVETIVHSAWYRKIEGTLADWKMESSEEPMAWKSLHKDSFLQAYKRLSQTADSKIAKFNTLFELVPNLLSYGINVVALNASKEPGARNQISWQDKVNIVVGAALLDRGYVVKGLVNTYMPRGSGGGNVDAIQQRGRFYGYKRKYLEFIRIRLARDLLEAYRSYASSEADLYRRLKEFAKKNEPFQNWERIMIMDPKLKPCRANVIGIDLAETVPARGQWYFPAYPDSSSFDYNKNVFQEFLNDISSSFSQYSMVGSDEWSLEASCMKSTHISLEKVLKYFTRLEVSTADSNRWQAVKLTLAWLRDKSCKASIFLMGTKSIDIDEFATRKRKLSTVGAALTSGNIFQGKNSRINYPGARQIFDLDKDVITIQINKLRLEGSRKSGEIILPCLRVSEKIKVIREK